MPHDMEDHDRNLTNCHNMFSTRNPGIHQSIPSKFFRVGITITCDKANVSEIDI